MVDPRYMGTLPAVTVSDEDAISLPSPDDSSVPLPPDVASRRATKTVQTGLVDKSQDEIMREYTAGNENLIRKQAATTADFNHRQETQKQLENYASTKQGPLDPKEVMRFLDPFNPNNQPADPDLVIERAYAANTVSSLNTAKGFMLDNLMTRATMEAPVETKNIQDDGSDLLAKNTYISHKLENLEATISQQSWPAYGADFAKNLFQPYVEYKQRGLIGSALAGIGLGSNIDEAHYTLYKQDLNTFKANVDKAYEYLKKDNPQLAQQYLQGLLSQNSWDSALNNTFSAMAVPDYIALGKGGAKVLSKAGKLNQARKATSDLVDAVARNPNADATTVAEGLGDTKGASTTKIAKAIQEASEGRGNPIEMAKDTLLSTWYDDAKKFISNPGTYLSRELTTRIMDDIPRDGEDLFKELSTSNRPERLPGIMNTPESVDLLREKYKSNYKGPSNTLLDTEGPIKEPVSNTYWFKHKIGNYDGTQFPDEATARGFAEQLGISEPIIKGTTVDTVYLPEAAIKRFGRVEQSPKGARFFDEDGVEVLSSPKPEPGKIPYDLRTGKFGSKLTEQTAVAQQGLGFHIEAWVPMKETDDFVRDLMIKTKDGKAIEDATSMSSASGTKAVVNSLLGWVRNSEDTLSKYESQNRQAVTYAQSNIHRWAHDLAKDLEDVASGRVREDQITGEKLNPLNVYPKSLLGKIKSRQVAQEFHRTLDFSRQAIDPISKEPGSFFKTAGDLQDFYQRNFKRDPSYLETKAYFNFAKLVEGDRMMREVSEFRYRARLGTEQHSFVTRDAQTGEKIRTGFMDGIKLDHFPGGDEYILVLKKNKGDESLFKLGHINDKTVEDLRAKVKSGEGKVIQIYDKNHEPLSGEYEVAKNKLIQYVYTESSESKPIEFNHVVRRGGGHFEWDYDQYIKQADIRAQYNTGLNNKIPGLEHVYVGDKTIMPIKNGKLGSDVAKLWNETHPFILKGDFESIRPMVAKLGIKHEDFVGWYQPDKNGKSLLNAREPIVVVPKNKKISQISADLSNRYRIPIEGTDKFRETFRDATKSGPANNFKVEYNQERNSVMVSTINDIGTEGNPIYAHQPADMVDPLTTMNRALNRVIQSTFMDDYKISTVEHWLREAGKWLDAKESELRSTPFAWFQNPVYRSGTPQSIKMNLESQRFKAQQFIGMPNKFDTWVHDFTSNLADKFYESYGPEGSRTIVQKAKSIVPIAMLHSVKDPVQFMRSVTFNFKLGLFAIPQFLVQAQTHALIWALEPRHGSAGTYAMLLHGWSKFTDNPEVLRALDNYATKMNFLGSKWKPGEFTEAMSELKKAGFENVAGEYSNINNQLKTRFILNDFDKGLKLGQYPFRLGEQSTRVTAWYTAFREYREANPTGAISNLERNKILQKADLLTVNMSRASSSMLNHGAFSLSTQFLTYQIKLAELFWGKRLADTAGERWLARARMVTLFSALYGVPNAVGVTGAPISDNLREHFMDDLGYIPGQKWMSTMLNEGIPAWQMSMITGKLDNIGDRFGSQGFQNIKQALRGDIPWWQAVGGAAVSTTAKFVNAALDPFSQYMSSWIRGDKDDDRFSIRSADLVEPLKQISSISTGAKAWTAMKTGEWISNNEQYVTDVTPLHAALLAVLGTQPQEADTAFLENNMVQGETDAKKSALKDIIKDYRRGVQAKANNDPEQGDAYFRNAWSRAATVGMSPEEINTAIALGMRGQEEAIDNADRRMWQKGDYNKRDARLNQYKQKLDLKDK